MGIRKIRWSKKSSASFLSILKWYQEERGQSFATKFYVGILNTIDLLAQMPTIGKLEEKMVTPIYARRTNFQRIIGCNHLLPCPYPGSQSRKMEGSILYFEEIEKLSDSIIMDLTGGIMKSMKMDSPFDLNINK